MSFAYDATVFAVSPNEFQIQVGCIILPADVPSVDLPSPRNQAHFDWLMWDTVFALQGTSRVDSTASLVLNVREWDVKSQRRLNEQHDSLWLIWTATDAVSSVAIAASVLVKLH